MRVLVCGGREYTDVARLWRVLDNIDAETRISCVIDGASDDVTGPYVGADYWGHQWALARGKSTIRQHAKWSELGRAAGPIRNYEMISLYKPDLCVAAPGGHGTADMLGKCERAGVEVFQVGVPEKKER